MTQNHDQQSAALAALDDILSKAPAGPGEPGQGISGPLAEAIDIAEREKREDILTGSGWATALALIDIAETLRAIYSEGIRIERP